MFKIIERFKQAFREVKEQERQKELKNLAAGGGVAAWLAEMRMRRESKDLFGKNPISRAQHVKATAFEIAKYPTRQPVSAEEFYAIALIASRKLKGPSFTEDLVESEQNAIIQEIRSLVTSKKK